MGVAKAIAGKMQRESERVERARADFNFRSIQSWLPQGSKVLDVGAWACYLGQLMRDHKDCQVLSLDVIDANKTDMPFQKFDGRNLPVDSRSYDVVLLLYVLHHAADDGPLLAEAGRVLRDRGRLLVAEDCVDTLWDKILTEGFHVWLWMIAGMSRDGRFRKTGEWQAKFRKAGFQVRETIPLGHHIGRSLWPNNVLYVLEKEADQQQ
jgi:SAM-dependent methyltransferase